MRQVYEEVKTPFKYGVVIRGEEKQLVDSPSVFRKDGQWYMVYIASTKDIGYETCLARSADLLRWERLGRILSFSAERFYRLQRAGSVALSDTTWERLGVVVIPKMAFEEPDGSRIRIDTDYLGKQRNHDNPFAGPFDNIGEGPVATEVR